MKGSIIAFDPCPHCENHDMCSKCELTFRRSGVIANPCEWISVEERLPEIKEFHYSDVVLVCFACGTIGFDRLEEDCFGGVSFFCEKPSPFGEDKGLEVTHWMPLPDAPKGGAE